MGMESEIAVGNKGKEQALVINVSHNVSESNHSSIN